MPRKREKRKMREVLAVLVIAGAVAVLMGVIWSWVRGDASGIVTEKEVVMNTTYGRYGCRQVPCPRITYVTDDGRTRRVCVLQYRFDRTNIGDRFTE